MKTRSQRGADYGFGKKWLALKGFIEGGRHWDEEKKKPCSRDGGKRSLIDQGKRQRVVFLAIALEANLKNKVDPKGKGSKKPDSSQSFA